MKSAIRSGRALVMLVVLLAIALAGCDDEEKSDRKETGALAASFIENTEKEVIQPDQWTIPSRINVNSLAPAVSLAWNEGAPTINVDGEAISPLILFFSADFDLDEARDNLQAQLEYARREGVKIVSINISFPWHSASEEVRNWQFNHMNRWLDFVLEIYPEAYILPRVWLGMHPMDLTADPGLDDDIISFMDGTRHNMLSLGSETWQTGMIRSLQEGISYLESNSKYGPHMIGYHLAYGESGEWFHYQYRRFGNDLSLANREAFRKWLLAKYGSEEAWAHAWNLGENEAVVPIIYPRPSSSAQTFLRPDTDQAFIDYAIYNSDIVADSLIAASRTVKRETGGERLTMAFYGYAFDLIESHSGHLALEKVLASEAVDMLSSPISYLNRGVGGMGAFMTTVDSVALHRKLWMIEDDTRTHLAASSDFDVSIGSLFPTAELTAEAHKRNLGSAIAHRTGLWWMDLQSKGWLNDSSLWDNIGAMRAFYYDYMRTAKPIKPEVAIVVDERSVKFAGRGLEVYTPLLYHQRLALYRSGLFFGTYLLDDVLDGSVPDAKMYIFLNTHVLTESQRKKLEKLKADQRTFVWVYGADLIGNHPLGTATGFKLKGNEGESGTGSLTVDVNIDEPWKVLAGISLPLGIPNVPYYAVEADSQTTIVAQYDASGEAGIALRDFGDWKSVFFASGVLDVRFLQAVAAYSGVHVYMDSQDVVQTDGTFFSVYASKAGVKTLRLPANGDVTDALTGETLGTDTNRIELDMFEGQARWLLVK